MKKILPLLASALLAAGALAAPAVAADADNGRKLAEHWCASCHVVSSAQKQASADVPTFAEMARRKDAKQLALFLTKTHGQMPDLSLSQPEVADLVRWIVLQGPNPPPADTGPEPKDKGLSGAITPQK
ncbi:MAG: cytochrome c [Beijerinckiaceae bacterium]